MGTFIIGRKEQMIAGIPVGRLSDLEQRVKALEEAGGGAITVQDIDGNPTVPDVSTIRFSNGSVTDNGSGTVTVTTGGTGTGYTIETPSGSVNSSNVTFTVTSAPVFIISDGITYFENAGYTRSSLTITMDVPPSSYIRSFY